MARQVRVEFPGALYHLKSLGNRREDIYLDNHDKIAWLHLFGEICERFDWVCYAYCLMPNQYVSVIQTNEGNLSQGMRHLNGVYTQRFNRRHNRVGHLFQGRYKAILVEKDRFLLELTRDVILSPIRAGIVDRIDEWPWSSLEAFVGKEPIPAWLETRWLLSRFSGHSAQATQKYIGFVEEGMRAPSVWKNLRNQTFLGSEEFVQEIQDRICRDAGVSNIQKLTDDPKPLNYFKNLTGGIEEAMALAYRSGHYTMTMIGDYFGVHSSTVSRAVKAFEDKGGE